MNSKKWTEIFIKIENNWKLDVRCQIAEVLTGAANNHWDQLEIICAKIKN